MKIIVALAFTLAAVFGAGVARADDMDDAFLKYLAAHGVKCGTPTPPFARCQRTGGPADLIMDGHAICDFANGNDLATERKGILAATTGNLTPLQIDALMTASLVAYCPEYEYLAGG
jgi:hypothetical protein